jgi:hypothetical protein
LTASPRRRPLAALALTLPLLLLPAARAHAGLPSEGACPRIGGGEGGAAAEDASGELLKEGSRVGLGDLMRLQRLIPEEVWQHRDVFFHEGMQLEIGPCHRRYSFPSFYEKATAAHAGTATLDDDGNLSGYEAGLPFPPDAIDTSASDAGTRWAWNLALRYRGAGPIGKFRITDLPSRIGSPETYLGSFFWLQTANRSDLVAANPDAALKNAMWVAGGRFDEPFNARELAWRQIRPESTQGDYEKSDDTFVYVPAMRKPRRAATPWVDGLYTPRFRVSGTDSGGGALPFGSTQYGPESSINPTAGLSIAASENLRRGFEGLTLRPNAYRWSVKAERDVLAPLNGANPGYPENPDRNFGESGLSVASDRWDVRHAIVLEGVSKRDDEGEASRVTIYVDWQTQQPLYWVTRKKNGGILDIGILVHRYSGDVAQYPEWPGGGGALVFDPVAASFFSASEGRSGWRRESYDVRSVPVDEKEVRRMSSTDSLLHGR